MDTKSKQIIQVNNDGDTALLKNSLRQKLLSRFNGVNEDEFALASKGVCRQLFTLNHLRNAPHVAIYASIGKEINLSEFATLVKRRGTHIYYPRFNTKTSDYELASLSGEYDELIKGYMGIPEPRSAERVVDNKIKKNELLWLVPGIAFDKKGHRLGRGKGYYDRLLKGANGLKIGIGYTWQIIDHVPIDLTDVSMDYLVTDGYHCSCSK